MCLLAEGPTPECYRIESEPDDSSGRFDQELILSYEKTPLRIFLLHFADRDGKGATPALLEVRDGRGNYLYSRELSLPIRRFPLSALSEKRRHRFSRREGDIYPED
jgi:hypothetical protein